MRTRSFTQLLDLFERRVLLIDGAMGTCLQKLNLTPDDFGGAAREGCNEALLLTRPALITDVHVRYFEAGADIVETNTFGATPLVLAEYGLAEQARALNRLGAQVAKSAANLFSTPERPRFVAGSMGPTTCALSIAGSPAFDELVEHYLEQAIGLHEGGVDYFLIETCQDTLNLKAALIAIERLFEQGHARIPIAVSATLDTTGHMLAGQAPDAFALTLAPFDLLYVGLNCGAGVELLAPYLSALTSKSRTRIGLMPNAGLPDEEGHYRQSPDTFAQAIETACGQGILNLVGGCCGTTPEHIRALSQVLSRFTPRPIPPETASTSTSFLTGIDTLELDDVVRPIIAGERSNALGSKNFRNLIRANDFDAAADFARRQLDEGAHLLDIAVQQADRDEAQDLDRLLAQLVPRIRAPLMIDSMNPEAVSRALGRHQGKAIVNSANLEAGEARFLKMARVARSFGAALVIGLIDEKGMAVDLSRKCDIAERAVTLLEGVGFERSDLYIDALVFPCASADPAYVGAARETVKAISEIKCRIPGIQTALGISNVSFGLPAEARALVTSLFFESCTQAGLDLAIANAAKVRLGHGQASKELVEAAHALLSVEREDPKGFETWKRRIADLTALVREREPSMLETVPATPRRRTPEECIEYCVIQGTKDGLIHALEAELARGISPMALVNGPLMRGMDEVGRRFNAGERIVVEVLRSAEVMKAAIIHLESKMGAEKIVTRRGCLLLATVKGDVHDIGKNLVSMIFSSNGFEVLDLGTKVEDAQIVAAALDRKPDVIGLSGLLVKSALQMIETAKALDTAGVRCPLMVGGAALSEAFVDQKLQPVYSGLTLHARDAMQGLAFAQKLAEPDGLDALGASEQARRERRIQKDDLRKAARLKPSSLETSKKPFSLPVPPDLDPHVSQIDLHEIWAFLNQTMLYGHHLGLRGDFLSHIDEMDEGELEVRSVKALMLRRELEAMKQLFEARAIRPKALHRFVQAEQRGDAVFLWVDDIRHTLDFPRIDGHCIADFVAPSSSAQNDTIALFAVTAGQGIAALSDELQAHGEFLKCHLAQVLALAMAEAGAEWLHARIRNAWGLEAPVSMPDVTMRRALLARHYQGGRFSPGYRMCPDLKLQQILFEILDPSVIGIELTECWMMQPEASVSGFVFHHPAASR